MEEKQRKFLLKVHKFYYEKVETLKREIVKLKVSLREEEFKLHPDVKFAFRLREASEKIIPEDPDRSDYKLHGKLKKYRRYKQGLKRYRLFFSFSSKPPVILYLYVNDKSTLRNEGSKKDPYVLFKNFVDREVSHDPNDPAIQKWIKDFQ